jgi:large subunit ribosomal protein L25
MIELKVKNRAVKESLDSLRKAGSLPAVFYGKKTDSTPISMSKIDFLKVWKNAGESTVVTLKRAEGDIDALIHDVDVDPVSGAPRHADFYVFDKDLKITVDVPLEYIGVSPAVKDLGALLVKVLHEIKIEALPKDLPHMIEADISKLDVFGSQILAKDLKLGNGVSLAENPEEVIALVTEPKAEKEEEAAPVDLSTIEVAAKGKEKNATEEGAEEAPAEAKKEE